MSNKCHIEAVRLTQLFKALSSPKRLELLSILEHGCCDDAKCCTAEELSLCIDNLACRLGLVKSTVSHHLKELDAAGLISLAKRGRHNDFSLNRRLLRHAGEFLVSLAGCCEADPCCKEKGE